MQNIAFVASHLDGRHKTKEPSSSSTINKECATVRNRSEESELIEGLQADFINLFSKRLQDELCIEFLDSDRTKVLPS